MRYITADASGQVLDGVASGQPATVNTLAAFTRWSVCQRDSTASQSALAARWWAEFEPGAALR